jgi:integrase
VASLQGKIAIAERQLKAARGEPVELGRYPLSTEQLALRNYEERLAQDEKTRNTMLGWADVSVDDLFVAELRAGIAGKLTDAALQELVGRRIERYKLLGNTTVAFGSDEWRAVARAMCVSELEALSRVVERDEGDYSGSPEHPLLLNVPPVVEEKTPVLLRDLFNRYVAELKANGRGEGAERRWRPVIEDLIVFARTTDAQRLTKKVLVEWKDAKMKSLAPRTVRDVYFTAVNAVLNWAVANDQIDDNPARTIKIKVAAKPVVRPKGFTYEEAQKVLQFSRAYKPKRTGNTQTEEASQTSAAKAWAPLLCAYTGSRISEITQLRKEDVRLENGIHFIRITPDAGRVKNRQYRDVPLHQHIIEEGFLELVDASSPGPIFYPTFRGSRKADPAQTVSGRISNWLKASGVVPEGVSPNHGWRHAFKTTGLEVGIDARVLDAIQGHAARTAGENYGDVTLVAKKRAIDKLPTIVI